MATDDETFHPPCCPVILVDLSAHLSLTVLCVMCLLEVHALVSVSRLGVLIRNVCIHACVFLLVPADTEDVCIVERLFSSSLVAIVSLKAPRKLKVCHFKKGTEICNYSYSNTILAVKLNRQVSSTLCCKHLSW